VQLLLLRLSDMCNIPQYL